MIVHTVALALLSTFWAQEVTSVPVVLLLTSLDKSGQQNTFANTHLNLILRQRRSPEVIAATDDTVPEQLPNLSQIEQTDSGSSLFIPLDGTSASHLELNQEEASDTPDQSSSIIASDSSSHDTPEQKRRSPSIATPAIYAVFSPGANRDIHRISNGATSFTVRASGAPYMATDGVEEFLNANEETEQAGDIVSQFRNIWHQGFEPVEGTIRLSGIAVPYFYSAVSEKGLDSAKRIDDAFTIAFHGNANRR